MAALFRMPRPAFLALSLLSLLTAPGCDTEDDDTTADGGSGAGGSGAGGSGAGGSGAGGEAAGPCGPIDCSGHGTCSLVGGLPDCECDDGYTASGLDCISATPTTPAPPEGFTCPAPGAGNEALFTQLTADRLYYSWNDRTCGPPSWRMIYTFRADGVFMIQSQFKAAVGADSGSLDYGCYTYAIEMADGADALRLNYAYSNESNRNCSMLAGLDDPPCSGLLSARPEGGFLQAESLADNQETQVFWPLTDDACVWCSTAATCCPNNSWTADSSGPICP